jgi:hypothetical protein
MDYADLDQAMIEGRILYYIDRVYKGAKILNKLSIELDENRIRLRVLIDAYRQHYGKTAVEDLVGAIIKDNVLPKEEIMFVCSFDEESFQECIHNINIRNQSKR